MDNLIHDKFEKYLVEKHGMKCILDDGYIFGYYIDETCVHECGKISVTVDNLETLKKEHDAVMVYINYGFTLFINDSTEEFIDDDMFNIDKMLHHSDLRILM